MLYWLKYGEHGLEKLIRALYIKNPVKINPMVKRPL